MEDDEDYSHVTPKNCKACGDKIPLARLDALPKTQFCVKCTDGNTAPKVYDPEVYCAKASQSCSNGFAPSD